MALCKSDIDKCEALLSYDTMCRRYNPALFSFFSFLG
ncbi:hypothetical protein 7t3_0568 [Salmonella phage 7t3]|nr:hypothetical protein 7t3_0568 [Salmonella phage 7t3]